MTSTLSQASDQASEIARDILAAVAERRQIAPVSERHPGFDLAFAYRVTAAARRLRESRGERVVGRKIGFTDRAMWAQFGVDAPIWGYMYDTTVRSVVGPDARFDPAPLLEPRIEPEIVFKLARTPEAGMDERDLLSCVEWVAHGFEIVHSPYTGWRFAAADAVAALGLHAVLLIGSPHQVTDANAERWQEKLAGFEITLLRNGVEVEHGRAANILGREPLSALRHLVQVLARDPENPAVAPGEIVSTGTLTRAFPIGPGEAWSTAIKGLPLPGLRLTF